MKLGRWFPLPKIRWDRVESVSLVPGPPACPPNENSPAVRPIAAKAVSAMTLNDLQPGQSGTVLTVTGDDAISRRLMEMGILDGEVIELVGRAPLGDPLDFVVRGYHLSLRADEARRVEITPG